MSLISFSDVSFTYDGSYDPVFEHLDLQLDTDWKLGVIGRNGRGKTTLLRLLMRQLEPSGRIDCPVPCAYFPYPVADPARPALEVAAGAVRDFQLWQLERELARLNVAPTVLARPFATLSNGEQTKLLLAALLLNEEQYLLIDEPTNHLDLPARQLVGDYLRGKQGFMLVSHDRAFLDRCVDHVLSIGRSTVEVQRGNYSTWQLGRDRQDALELAQNQRLRREIQRLDEASQRAGRWSDRIERGKTGGACSSAVKDRGYIGHQAARMAKRAKSIEIRRQAAVERTTGLLKDIEQHDALKLFPQSYRAPVLAEARDLVVQYGAAPVCGPVSFAVRRGARLALAGRNGSGKSSILKLLAGQDIPHHGLFRMGGGIELSYVPQDASFLRGSLTDWLRGQSVDQSQCMTILRKLGFARVQFEKSMDDYSAGQKKKVLLAASLCRRAHLYLWDEPLNYIDLLSRQQLEQLLLEFAPTMVFVEHDELFCRNVATEMVPL